MPAKSYKKKMIKKKAPSRWDIYSGAGAQLIKDVNTLKNLINVEYKAVARYTNTTIGTGGNLTLLNGIDEGDDFNQRNGRSIRIKSINMAYQGYPTATTANGCNIRCMIILDTQPNGSAPAVSDILDNSSGVGYVRCFRNLDNRKRFRVLMDFCHPVYSASVTQNQALEKYYKKLNFHTYYKGTGNTISDIASNSLYHLCVSDQTSTTVPAVNCLIRLRYLDN